MKFLVCFLAISSFASVFGQFPINGTCPATCDNHKLNVTAEQLVGLWIVQYSIPYYYESDAKCSYTRTTKIGDNKLKFEKIIRDKKSNEKLTIEGTTVFSSDGHSTHQYTDLKLPLESQLLVVTPDLVVEMACHDCGFFEKEGSGIYAKIYTRLTFPECPLLDKALDVLADCGIPKESLQLNDQSNCNFC